MKKFLKNIMVFFVISSLVLTSVCAYAQKKSEPLYEKYGYNENFVYTDEFIAHALKSSVVLVLLNYEAAVEYSQVTFDVDTIKAFLESVYSENSDRFTKEEFSALVVKDMQENIKDYITWGKPKKVPVEATWSGSGVVIDEFGYIATNSHVVSLDEDSKLEACLMELQSGIKDDLKKVLDDLTGYEIFVTEEQVASVYEAIVKEAVNEAEIVRENSELYVCFPAASGDTSLDKERAFKAKVVAEGVSISVSKDGTTQDAAILEINKEGLVALKISDSYPEVNTKIVSAGFPGAADAIFQMNGSNKSVLSATVGTGNISRHVPIDGHDYKALEITTTISGGNSGGPSVDETLRIEGLNTYGNSEDMRYAYMIPAEYVKELAKEFNVGQGEVSIVFLTGLQMLQQKHGAAALECFTYVKNANKDVPYIDSLIELSKKAPQNGPGNDNSSDIDYKTLAIVGIVVAAAAIIVIIVLIFRKPKKKESDKIQELPERFEVFNTIESPTSPSDAPSDFTAFAPSDSFTPVTEENSLADSTHDIAPQKIITPTASDTTANTQEKSQPVSGRFIGSFKFDNNNNSNNQQ